MRAVSHMPHGQHGLHSADLPRLHCSIGARLAAWAHVEWYVSNNAFLFLSPTLDNFGVCLLAFRVEQSEYRVRV